MHNAIRATLYLGASIRGEHAVDNVTFEQFLTDYVTPRFSGFTVTDALGYWLGKREWSRQIVILADGPLTAEFTRDVEKIARDYKRKFEQDAVMISYEPVRVLWDVPAVSEPLCTVPSADFKPVMAERGEPHNPNGAW